MNSEGGKIEPLISVIIPVRDDAGALGLCLERLKKLDYPPHRLEVIVADGLSRDETASLARQSGARVVTNRKQTVGPGRNRGFEIARGELIAFTDADCLPHRDWLKNCLKYFQDSSVAAVSGPVITPLESTSFARAIGYLYDLAGRLHSCAHRQRLEGVREVDDIPGCNSIYRREVLDETMPIDESLLTAEDAELNFRIRKLGYKLLACPDIIVWHQRRSSPKSFFRQVYRFAIGRLQAGKRDIKMLGPLHILVGLSIPLVLAAGGYLCVYGLLGLFLKIALASLLIFILLAWLSCRSLSIALNMPLAVAIFAIAWSMGFLRELFFPLKDTAGK
jgi:cellulose synthase/poly-beta-1,6-N-acetylglucosamine synthase-like glycosyltransferase